MLKVFSLGGVLLPLLFTLSACSKKEPAKPLTEQEILVKRGKAVYMGSCIACHNANPKLAGGIGPDIAFSSLELIEARVMRGEYPEGYKPKRQTKVMVAMEELKDDIPAIHAYLNSFQK